MINKSQMWFLLLVFLIGVIINLNTLPSFFVGDDFDLIYVMKHTRHWTEFLTFSFWGVQEPLWGLSIGIDQRLWGLNQYGYHIQNILFHALNGAMIYLFVFLLLDKNRLPALFAALIFITHPVHDEAVAYISGRPHTITTFFSLITLIFYHQFREKKRWFYLLFSIFFLIQSFAAKEISFTLPVVVSVYELAYRFEKKNIFRSFINLAIYTLPYYMVLLFYLILRMKFFPVHGDKVGKINNSVVELGKTIASKISISNIFERLPGYLSMLFIPFPFSRFTWIQLEAYAVIGLIISVAVILAALILVYLRKTGGKIPSLMLFSAITMFVMLIPVFHNELSFRRRYTYYSSMMFSIFLGIFIWRLIYRTQLPNSIGKNFKVVVVTLFALYVMSNAVLLVYNNINYYHAGQISRNVIDDILAGIKPEDRAVNLFLFGFPRYCGGDGTNGAYLFHYSDFRSAMYLYFGRNIKFDYVFKTYYANDFTSKIEFLGNNKAVMSVNFKTDASFLNSYYSEIGESDDNGNRRMTILGIYPDKKQIDAEIYFKNSSFGKYKLHAFRFDSDHYYPVEWGN
ncbi:MAG: hypothetical protein A2161_10530 [Candidatus Schekmanbacteria bacterium RBG_13_48_7]|uniref:Glycosyltransferase RgtA/B/C/D-like domain-containing protein n=1 Tax=Candidatus Schekmanbacteria bacterium RBG_13_48_7 TaxID=1817878 RepID=A0A1F7RX36_9BACT|nr:MAG: hypothetical protein A2161_10530 [Candidatus Schekmanbacteria bacterium RBG_13_48_7]